MKRINRDFFYIIFIVIVGFGSFHSFLDNYFIISDDFPILDIVSSSKPFFYKLISLDIGHFFMPVPIFFLIIFLKLFQFNPFWFYFTSICVHIINSILVYQLSKFIINNKFFSFVSSLIFLVYRHNARLASGLSVLDNSISVFFYLFSFVFFINYLNNKTKRNYWLWLIVFLLAILSKESAALLLFIYFLFEYLFSDFDFKKEIFRKYVPFAIVTFIYLIFQVIIQQRSYLLKYNYYSFGYHAVINMLNYIIGLLIPIKKFIDASHKIFFYDSISIILSLLIIVITIILFIKGSKRIRFLISWIYITFIPYSFFTSSNVPRYSYIPLVGFSILIGLLLFQISMKLNQINKTLKNVVLSIIIVTIVLTNVFLVNIDEQEYEFGGYVSEKIILDFSNVEHLLKDNALLFFKNDDFSCSHLRRGIQVFYEVDNLTFICKIDHLKLVNRNLEDFLIIGYKNGIIQEIS
ncbi:glycosyltransferase family 39 protein [Candidatus Woesearchaeota archaeon]|nr:glycosyltransferase family 39 protein [Candidatus Woesearchaeota archaeon]